MTDVQKNRVADSVSEEFAQRVRLLEDLFDFERFERTDFTDPKMTSRYYRASKWAYRRFNNREGFVHFGVSRDGRDKPSDYEEMARTVAEYIRATGAKRVLELAAGQAANLGYLAERFPGVHFVGLDLPNGQLDYARRRTAGLANVELVEGNYHDLSRFNDAEFDVSFVVEGLCHSVTKDVFFAEQRRVLKPGGLLFVSDGYRAREPINEIERRGVTFIERGIAIEAIETYPAVVDTAVRQGFTVFAEENMSAMVLPSARKLTTKAERFFRRRWLARAVIALAPRLMIANAAPAYLAALTYDLGLYSYWFATFRNDRVQRFEAAPRT